MTAPPVASAAVATCLEQLERLGLVRPASALVTDYLAALAAEQVLDAETAARVGAAYHRLRYGISEGDEAEVREAVARLEGAARSVATMPDEARRNLVERIRLRLQPAAAIETSTGAPAAAQSSAASARLDWATLTSGAERGRKPSDDPVAVVRSDSGSADEPEAAPPRRDLRLRSLPLETAALAIVGLVVVGYVLRNGIDHAIGSSEADAQSARRTHVIPQDVWKHSDYWTANLRRRANREAARKHEQTARLAYELLVADAPRDAGALNDLAWLYLTADDHALRDHKRGLELALRALAVSRAPSILDTAAEARFQNGQLNEAVKLEREALDTVPRFAGFEDKRFWKLLEQQLEKFQSAAKTAH